MSDKNGYKQQRNLSSVQLLAEAPFFIANLLSALFSGTVLLYVDLMDSLNYIIRNAMVLLLSNKLSKDLRFEYNYGVGKIEAISSSYCFVTIILAHIFLKERLTRKQYLSLAFVVAGIALLGVSEIINV